MKVGIFSPNDYREWVRESNIDMLLKHESLLIDALESRNVKVIRGGDGLPKEDQIAWNSRLVKLQARKIASESPDAIIINHGDWAWPYDTRDAITIFAKELPGIQNGIAKVLIYCYKDTQVPGLVAGMASAGALQRIGIPYKLVFGKIDQEPDVLDSIMSTLEFYERRTEITPIVMNAISQLHEQKYLALGGMSLKMATATADVDQWAKLFGISYDAFDQSELTIRAKAMIRWQGEPGRSKILGINDSRLEKALEYIYHQGHGKFDFSRDKLKTIDKFIYQLSFYYAAVDFCEEHAGTFMGIKCQDELSGRECTQCITAAYLNNDVGPEGLTKKPIPVACENDMDSSLTQLWLYLLNGNIPAGFGDFRDIENNILAIVNCGQHPPYFFGTPEEDSVSKLDKVEYMGQEVWYHAGGASVRGRTPGGQTMTLARLYRENLRYSITAIAVETVDMSEKVHEKYSISWPVILAKMPIDDKTVIDLWPCNHLGFAYGDFTPHIVEMAERLGIGYKVYDRQGNLFSSPG